MNSVALNECPTRPRVHTTSPLMFESDEEDTLVEEDPSNSINKENSENSDESVVEPTKEEKLLKGLQTVLMGIPPPPAFTVPQLDSREILKLWRDHQRFRVLLTPNEVSAKKDSAEKSENEAKSTKWPEVRGLDHWGICYNKSSISEDVERLAVRYKERYVGAETSSCINSLYAKSPMRTASARKRARHRNWGHSPGRRLSHLARRRKAFSSASLCSVAGNNNPDKKMIMVEIKKIGGRQKKKNSAKKTKPTPKKKNSAQGSTFKRALFQSPDQLPAAKADQTPSSQGIQRSKRNLFAESSSEKKVNDNGKRERPVMRRMSPRKRVNRSLSFHDSTQPTTLVTNLVSLSGAHKQKMLWAATNALREEGMGMSHELFRPCMTVLFKTCQKLWLSHPSKLGQEGSTSEKMLALARQFTAYTIKEISSDPTSEHMALVFNNNIKMAENILKQADVEKSSIAQASCEKLPANENVSEKVNDENNGNIPASSAETFDGSDAPIGGSVKLQKPVLKESPSKTKGTLKKVSKKISSKHSTVNQWEVSSTVLSDDNIAEKGRPDPIEEIKVTPASPGLTSPITRSKKALMNVIPQGVNQSPIVSPDLTSPKLSRKKALRNNVSAKKESRNDCLLKENESPIAILNFTSPVIPIKSVLKNVISDKNEEKDNQEKSNKSLVVCSDLTSPVVRKNPILTKDVSAKSDKNCSPEDVSQSPMFSPDLTSPELHRKRTLRNNVSAKNDSTLNKNESPISILGFTSPVIPLKSVLKNVISDKNEEKDYQEKSNESLVVSSELTSPVVHKNPILSKNVSAKSDKNCSPEDSSQLPMFSQDLTSPELHRKRTLRNNVSAKKESKNVSTLNKNESPISILGFTSPVIPLKSVITNIICDKNGEKDSQVKSNKSLMVSSNVTSPVVRLQRISMKDVPAGNDNNCSPAHTSQSPMVSPHLVLSRRRSKRILSNGSSSANEDTNSSTLSLGLERRTSLDLITPKVPSECASNSDEKSPIINTAQTSKPPSRRASVKTPLKSGNNSSGLVKNISLKENDYIFISPTQGNLVKYSPAVKGDSENCLSKKSYCAQLETNQERDIETNKENINVEVVSDSEGERNCRGQSGSMTLLSQKVLSGSNNRTLELYRLSNTGGEHVETNEFGQTLANAEPPKLLAHWEQEEEVGETSSSDSPPSLVPHWESCSGTSTSLPESIMTHWHQMSNNVIPSEKIMFDFEDTSYEIDFPSTNDDADTRASSTCAPFDFPHLAFVDDSKSCGFNTFSKANSPDC